MGGYGRGLAYWKEQQEQYGWQGGDNDKMRRLWLRDDEIARFWFVTEGDGPEGPVVPLLHMVAIPKKNGQGTWNKDVYCSRKHKGEPVEKCELCLGGDDPGYRVCMILYVTSVFHPGEGEGWVARKTSEGILYEEKVNDYRLLTLQPRLAEQVNSEYLGIMDELGNESSQPSTEVAKTLLDSVFTLKRQKINGRWQETLKRYDRTTPPEEIVQARKNAPDLIATCDALFGDSYKKGQKPTTMASGSGLGGDIDESIPGRTAALDDNEVVAF